MSRLADRLMGMDEGSRPVGLGGIPGLTRPASPKRKWRIVLALVILVGMAAVAAAVVLRPRGAVSTVQSPPVPAVRPVASPSPLPPARPTPAPELAQARAATARGDLVEASRLFREGLTRRPADAEGWNDLGVVRARLGDAGGAVEAFRRALDREPAHVEALRNLGVTLDRASRTREAAEQYRRFLAAAGSGHPAADDVRRRLDELDAPRGGRR